MIRIFKLVVLLVISQVAFGQAPSNYTNINGRYRWIAGMFDSTFHIPKGSTPSLRTGGSTNSGGLFYNTSDSSVYTYTGTQWIKLRGVIIDTTSLSNRINLKLNISDTASMLNPYLRKIDTTNKYVTQVYKKNASDSVFYVKGGNHIWAFNDSTGSPGGGGGGKIYYFNGGVSMGTFGGFTMYELGDTANTGTAANFTRATTGNIANFITDPNKPGLLEIPAGVWSVDAWLSETGGGSNHAQIYVIVEKWNGSTITAIATSPIEQITEGSTPNLYSWSVSIPTTSLTVTDRIIIQFYIQNTNGKTVTLYTQNGYIGEVHTTFTTGIGAINGLTTPAQYLVTGTSGTDFNINSTTATHTFNLPTASATNRGALSSANWSTFNSKIGPSDTASMLSPYFRLAGVGLKNTGQTVYADTLLLSTRAWRQKGIDSVAALINTAISGTTNYIPKFTSSSAIGNSVIYESSSNIGIGTISPSTKLDVVISSGPYNSRFYNSSTSTSEYNVLLFSQGASGSATGYLGTGGSAVGGAFANNFVIGTQSNNALVLSTNDFERLRISSTGNVSIGNTNNTYKLDVSGDVWFKPATGYNVLFQNSGTTLRMNYLNDAGSANISATYRATDFGWQDGSGNGVLTLNSSGNLGLGVTPNAWSASFKALQVTNAAALWSATNGDLYLTNNVYNDGTNRFVYGSGSAYAARYAQIDGQHIFYTASGGTAGNAISFTQAMTLDASGRLGIGSTSPAGKVHIAATTGTAAPGSIALAIRDSGNSAFGFDFNLEGVATGDLYLMRTLSGTQSTVLQIARATGAATFSSSVTASGGFEIPNGQFYRAIRSSGSLLTDMIGIPSGTDDVRILTTGDFNIVNGSLSNILTVKNGGNVGIGTTSPALLLELNSSTTAALPATSGSTQSGGGRLRITTTGASTAVIDFGTAGGSGGWVQATNKSDLSTNYPFLINPNGGNVGIGTTSPNRTLTVNGLLGVTNGTANTQQFIFSIDGTAAYLTSSYIGSSSYVPMAFEVGGSERMRITSGGELLVNTTSDAGDYKLQVNGNGLFAGRTKILGGAIADDGVSGNNIGIGFGATSILSIDGSGNLATKDIGTSANPWGSLYLNGSIKTAAPSGGTAKPWKLGEAGVSVGGANTTAVKVEIDGVVYYLLTAYLPEPEPDPAALPSSGPSASYKTYNKPIPVKTTKDVEIDNLKKEIEELKQLIKNK